MRSLILVLLLLNALFLSAQEATNNNLSFDNLYALNQKSY